MTDPLNDSLSAQPHPAGLAPVDPEKPTTVREIFYGPDGLRAGWGLLIFIALMAACLAGVAVLSKHLHLNTPKAGSTAEITPGFVLLGESLPFFATLFVTWIMSRIEKRPNGAYGLGGKRAIPNFLAGLAWGVACLSLLVLILWKTGLLVIDSRLLFGGDVIRYGLIWLFGFLMVGLLEEYLTRGYLLYTLTRGISGIYAALFETRHNKTLAFWTAALGLSTLFGLGHASNPGESPIGVLSAGLVFCFSLWRTGSLWWAIGFHTTWDWAQSFLYGVADSGMMAQHHLLATHAVGLPLMSGGTTGPEGSIFVLLVLALVSLIIIFTLPRTGYSTELQPLVHPIE